MRGFGRILMGCVAAGALSCSANAADLPVKAGPMPPIEVYNWTGFYVGGNVGGDWGRSDTFSPIANSGVGRKYVGSPIADINNQAVQSVRGSGFTGGAQAGYNYQVNHLVLGVEADIDAFRVAGTNAT